MSLSGRGDWPSLCYLAKRLITLANGRCCPPPNLPRGSQSSYLMALPAHLTPLRSSPPSAWARPNNAGPTLSLPGLHALCCKGGLGLSHFESLTVPDVQDGVLSRENCSLGRFLTMVLLTLGSRTLGGRGGGVGVLCTAECSAASKCH